MSKSVTSDAIREELAKDNNAKASDIFATLQARGINVKLQQIYQLRSSLRSNAQKRRLRNGQLSQHIVKVLEQHPNGLSAPELTQAVIKSGYVTRSKDLIKVVYKRLYYLTSVGKLSKNGSSFTLKSEILKDLNGETSDLLLLREAVVALGVNLGQKDPQGFPDRLIKTLRQLKKTNHELENLISAKK